MDRVTMTMACAAYLLVVVFLGVIVGRRVTSANEDYFLAKRRIPGWLVAFAAAAAGESAWVMMGLVGAGYTDGMSCFWLIPGCVLGYAFNILILGPALQEKAAAYRSVTLAEMIGAATGNREGIARAVAALIITVFLGSYVAAQFTAAGKAFAAFLGMPYPLGVCVGAIIVLAYTVLGGQKSIAWTHLLQASMMVLALVVVPIVGVFMCGGPSSLFTTLRSVDPSLLSLWHRASGWSTIGLVLGWAGVGLGYPGQPHVVMQYLAGKSRRDVRSGWFISITWAVLVFAGAIAAGMVARAWIGDMSDPERGLPTLAARMFPSWAQGLVLAAILAAICSTADSQLLAVTAALGVDLLGIRRNEEIEQWRGRLSARLILVAVGVATAAFALTQMRVIFTFVLYAWGVLGAGIGPVLIAVSMGRKMTGARASVAMVIGGGTAILWQAIPALKGFVYELVPAFLLGLTVTWLLSKRARPQELTTTEQQSSASTSL